MPRRMSRLSPVQIVLGAKLRAGLPTLLMARRRTVGQGTWDTWHTDKLNATGHRTRTGGLWTRQGAHQVHRAQERAAA